MTKKNETPGVFPNLTMNDYRAGTLHKHSFEQDASETLTPTSGNIFFRRFLLDFLL